MGFQRKFHFKSMILGQKQVHLRAVRKSFGHNKHINAIWRAQDAIELKHEGASRDDGAVFFWPFD
jgi:hypothetical protein